MKHRGPGRPSKAPVEDQQIERGMDTIAELDAIDEVLDRIRFLLHEVLKSALKQRNAYFETVRKRRSA